MGDVINLNRFRKKKAREEKQQRAETNKRLHGRTNAERARDEAQKRQIEEKLDGAYLVRDDVTIDDIPGGDAADTLDMLDAAVEHALPLDELSPKKSDED